MATDVRALHQGCGQWLREHFTTVASASLVTILPLIVYYSRSVEISLADPVLNALDINLPPSPPAPPVLPPLSPGQTASPSLLHPRLHQASPHRRRLGIVIHIPRTSGPAQSSWWTGWMRPLVSFETQETSVASVLYGTRIEGHSIGSTVVYLTGRSRLPQHIGRRQPRSRDSRAGHQPSRHRRRVGSGASR